MPSPPPLDPRAEAAALASAYRQSRLDRLLAVRQLAASQAAETRRVFRESQARQQEQERIRREELALAEAAKAQRELQARLAQAQAQLGEAQRNAALQAEQALEQSAAATARAHVLQLHTQTRYSKALTLVQQRTADARAAKEERRALKEAGKQAEKLVRVQLQRAAARQAATTPAHLLAYNKVTSVSAPATPAAVAARKPTPAQKRLSIHGRSSIPGGISPYTPSNHHAGLVPQQMRAEDGDGEADDEEPAALMQAQLPCPHPHPSSARRTPNQAQQCQVPQTPAAVAVALDFNSPSTLSVVAATAALALRAPLSAKSKALHAAQDQRKQRALMAHHDIQMARAAGRRHSMERRAIFRESSTERVGPTNAVRPSRDVQDRAFEIVLKRGQQVVTQRIGTDGTKTNVRPSSATTARSGNKKRSNPIGKIRRNTAPSARRRPVPVLVPNAAFFQQLQQNQADSADAAASLFNPVVQRSALGGAVAWTIPADGLDAIQPDHQDVDQQERNAPTLRGLQLAAAHTQRQKCDGKPTDQEKQQHAQPDTIEPVLVDLGTRYYTQAEVASFDIVRKHETDEQQATQLDSTPRRKEQPEPGREEVFSSPLFPLASAAAARVAAERAGTPLKAAQGSAPGRHDNSVQDLDRQLRSLLQSHLTADSAAAQRLFSPAVLNSSSGNGVPAAAVPLAVTTTAPAKPFVASFEPSALSDSDDEFEESLREMQQREDDIASRAHTPAESSFAFGSPGAAIPGSLAVQQLSFTSPASMDSSMLSPGAPPSTSGGQQALTDLFSSPTARTDLFLEEVSHALEQEKLLAAQVDAQLQQEALTRCNEEQTRMMQQQQEGRLNGKEQQDMDASLLATPAPQPIMKPLPYTTATADVPQPQAQFASSPTAFLQQQQQKQPQQPHHQQHTLTLEGAPTLPKQRQQQLQGTDTHRALFHTPTSSKVRLVREDELARTPYAGHATPVAPGLPPPTPVQAHALALAAQLSQLSPEQLRAQKPVLHIPLQRHGYDREDAGVYA